MVVNKTRKCPGGAVFCCCLSLPPSFSSYISLTSLLFVCLCMCVLLFCWNFCSLLLRDTTWNRKLVIKSKRKKQFQKENIFHHNNLIYSPLETLTVNPVITFTVKSIFPESLSLSSGYVPQILPITYRVIDSLTVSPCGLSDRGVCLTVWIISYHQSSHG